MNRYKKYKPSGIDLIGEIPSHWEEIKLKYIGYLYSGLTGKNGDDFKQIGNPENKSFIPFTNIANNIKIDPNKLEQVVMKKDDNQNKVLKGDLFFMMSSENFDDVGKSTILFDDIGEVYLNSFCKGFRVRDKNVNPLFLNYLLHNDAYRRRMMIEANGFTRINLKIEKVNDFFVSFPPKEEQTAIAIFLDNKTAQIDKLISNKQKLIELLKEERIAIINKAVTKGLNPEVKLIQSEIEWFKEIPQRWNLIKLKYLVNYVKGFAFKTEFFQHDGIPIIKASDIKNLTIKRGKDFLNPEKIKQFEKVRLITNDIIVSTVGSTPEVINSAVGQIAIIPEEFSNSYLNQNTVKFFSYEKSILNNNFLFYVLISNPYRKYLDLHAHGTANQASLNIEDMLNFIILLPEIEEQISIVIYIESNTQRINNTISKIKKEIELMQEYRTALISEVVTGKIKIIIN